MRSPQRRLAPLAILLMSVGLALPFIAAAAGVDSVFVAVMSPPWMPGDVSAAPKTAPTPSAALPGAPHSSFFTAECWAAPEGDRWRFRSARIDGRLPLPAPRGLEAAFELGALYRREPARADARFRSENRLLVSSPRHGAWIGMAAQRSDARDASWVPLFGIGGWSRARRVTIGAAIGQARDLVERHWLQAVDTLFVTRSRLEQITLTTASASACWRHPRLELEGTAGVNLSPTTAPFRWTQARATVWPWTRLGVIASAGTRAPVVFGAFGASADPSTSASLGLMIDPWRDGLARPRTAPRRDVVEWSLRRASRDIYALEVRAPEATTVEVMGDVTQWVPARLQRMSDRRFRMHIAMAPGVHHMNLRIDGGAWMSPPGAPLGSDDFGGSVGVIVAR